MAGIFNRIAFDRQISELVKNKNTSKSPFSLLMIDIDNFRNINDTQGRPTGDRIIMAVVKKCRRSIRADHFFTRYGGEEFMIMWNYLLEDYFGHPF